MDNNEDEYLSQLELVDEELKLEFSGKTQVSEPDENIYAYYFKMKNINTHEEMGFINIKAGYTENIIMNRGNIGFSVMEKFRGNKYSARSCKLIIPVLKYLGLETVYITCNSNNYSSKKNIEMTGAEPLETVIIGEESPYSKYYQGDSRTKLRYRWDTTRR